MYIRSTQLLHSEGKKSFISIQQEGWIQPQAIKIHAIFPVMRILMMEMMKRARGKTSFSEVLCCYGRISVLNIFLLN